MEEQHSARFEEVKEYYERHQWSKKRVRNAVIMEWITEEEYMEITGDPYV